MLQIKYVIFAMCLCVLFGTFSHAKFKGPDETPQYNTVHEILTHPVDGEKIKLTGRIVTKIGYNRYLFIDTDGTGEIPAIISDIVITFHKDFSPQDVVTIHAKISIKMSGVPELIVSSMDIS